MILSYLVLEKLISDMILKMENGKCAFSQMDRPNLAQRGSATGILSQTPEWRQRETEVPSVLPEASFALGYHDRRSQNMPPDDIQF